MIDSEDFEDINDMAQLIRIEVETGHWEMASNYWAYIQKMIVKATYVDFYNILNKKTYKDYLNYFLSQNILSLNGGMQSWWITYIIDSNKYNNQYNVYILIADFIYTPHIQERGQLLYGLMNGPVKQTLGLDVPHGNLAKITFDYLKEDFMKPVTNIGISQIYVLIKQK